MFRLLKVDGNKVLVRFSHLYTLKGHEHPGNRQIWLLKDEPVAFTYLWGEDGTTKKIVLKEVVGDDFVQETEAEGAAGSLTEPAGGSDAEAEPIIEQIFEGKKDEA